ncbi:MAG: aldo/keto reductase [bacterium]|nr:aldo/keto reductase [bacterium]
MKHTLLGSSGMRVSELCLGTMTFGEEWGWGSSYEESKRVFDTFANAGGNFIDTANRYTEGTSEKYCGDFIRSDRERFVLATKYSLSSKPGDPNSGGNHRKNMMQSVEASLKRLNTDYIDLYWLHAWDFTTPVGEVMRGLDDLVRSGKVLYIGISDTPAWIVSQANTIATLRGWAPFIALQIQYSLAERTPERDLLPMAKAFGMTVTPWGILGSGLLTGKYNKQTKEMSRLHVTMSPTRTDTKKLQIADVIAEVAHEIGCTASQVAIAWLRQQSGNMIPILGARTEAQLLDNLGALSITLNSEQMKRLDEETKVELGFPHDFLNSELVRNMVTAGCPLPRR